MIFHFRLKWGCTYYQKQNVYVSNCKCSLSKGVFPDMCISDKANKWLLHFILTIKCLILMHFLVKWVKYLFYVVPHSIFFVYQSTYARTPNCGWNSLVSTYFIKRHIWLFLLWCHYVFFSMLVLNGKWALENEWMITFTNQNKMNENALIFDKFFLIFSLIRMIYLPK